MPGVDLEITCNKLDVNPNAKLFKQKLRRMNLNRCAQLQHEVDKFLSVNFIEEGKYSRWDTNIVVVSKKNGKIIACNLLF